MRREDLIHHIPCVYRRTVPRMACAILRMGTVPSENKPVIRSGGEAGARDPTSVEAIDAADGNAYDGCGVKTLSTPSLAYTVVRSLEWLTPFSG